MCCALSDPPLVSVGGEPLAGKRPNPGHFDSLVQRLGLRLPKPDCGLGFDARGNGISSNGSLHDAPRPVHRRTARHHSRRRADRGTGPDCNCRGLDESSRRHGQAMDRYREEDRSVGPLADGELTGCRTEFATPEVKLQANLQTGRSLVIDWSTIAEIRRDGDLALELVGKKSGVRTAIQFPNSAAADDFSGAFEFLRRNCG